jgi:hypothetical protein
VIPLYRPDGSFVSVRAESIDGFPPEWTVPQWFASNGLVMCDPLAALLLKGAPDHPLPRGTRIVIARGALDFLSWIVSYSDADEDAPAVIGISENSWSQEIADRVPDGCSVYVAMPRDNGEALGTAVVQTFAERARSGRIELWRWHHGDANAHLQRTKEELSLSPANLEPVEFGPPQAAALVSTRLNSPPAISITVLEAILDFVQTTGAREGLAAVGTAHLGSLHFYRLLRWLIEEVHQRWRAYEPELVTLEIEGGWREIAAAVGNPGRKGTTITRDLITALGEQPIRWPDGSASPVVTCVGKTRKGTRPEYLVLRVSEALSPPFVHAVGRGLRGRRLVPLTSLPPFVGRANEQGAQVALQLRFLAHCRVHAKQMLTAGGIEMSDGDWRRLAERCGLPSRMMPEVVGAWLAGDANTPPFLRRASSQRYTLRDQRVLAFLLEAGDAMKRGGEAAKRKARRRHGAWSKPKETKRRPPA